MLCVCCEQMSEIIGDFPLVHPAMYGKQTRYTYIAVTDTQDPAAQFKVSLLASGFSPIRWWCNRGFTYEPACLS